MLAQAEALLKAQLDGAEKLQARIAGLMSPCVTLGSAAMAATAAAFGLFGKAEGLVQAWPWFFGLPILAAGAVWLYGAFVAVTALQGVVLASAGKDPRQLYAPQFMEAGKLELTLFMTRVLGEAIEENQPAIDALAQALRRTSNALRFAPLSALVLLVVLAFAAN